MLVLSLGNEDSFVIPVNNNKVVEIFNGAGHRIKLKISAPKDVLIFRKALWEQVCRGATPRQADKIPYYGERIMPKDITDYLNEQWDVLEAAVFNSMWPEVGLSPGWYVVYDSKVQGAVPQILLGPTSRHMAEHIRDCHNSLLDRTGQRWKSWA